MSQSTDYESSYFAEYIKAFNSQHFYGNTVMLSPQMLNTSLKGVNMFSSSFSTEQIRRMVMRPHDYEEELRKLSFFNFNTIGLYKQIVNFWSKMLTFDWNPIPYKEDGKPITATEFHSRTYKEDYAELTKFFNNFKAKDEFSKVLWNLCMYDTYFTSYREFDEHIYLQELPHSHCMIDADSYLGYLLNTELKNIMLQSGTTDALSMTSTVNMASAGIYKLFNSANISDVYGQFSNFCEYHINKKCKKYK